LHSESRDQATIKKKHLELKFCAGSNKVIFAEHAINLLSSLDLVVVLQANPYATGLKVSATHSGMGERVEVFILVQKISGVGGKVSFNAVPWIPLPIYNPSLL